jgi:electron transport complex protein RnfE
MSESGSPFVPNAALAGFAGAGILAAAADSLGKGLVLGIGASLCALVLAATIPALRSLVPDRLRAPSALSLAAALASLYSLALRAYSPATSESLGIFLPLLAVNCLDMHVLRRASLSQERVRSRDEGEERARFLGLAREALGYLLAAALVGALREAAGSGTISLPTPGGDFRIILSDAAPARLFVAPAGGFLLLGSMAAIYRLVLRWRGRRIP